MGVVGAQRAVVTASVASLVVGVLTMGSAHAAPKSTGNNGTDWWSSSTSSQPSTDASGSLGYDVTSAKGSLWQIKETVEANLLHQAGFTGKGVGVALIDTGVTEVRGLDTGNVYYGPDLSFDSQDPELASKDAYGHGTHLASIIAGRDVVGTPASYAEPGRLLRGRARREPGQCQGRRPGRRRRRDPGDRRRSTGWSRTATTTASTSG